MLFDVTITNAASICTLNILLNTISVVLVPSKISSSVILNNPNISSNVSILVTSCLVLSILSV